jgi:hypothetical protein
MAHRRANQHDVVDPCVTPGREIEDGMARGARELAGTARDCRELVASLALSASITLDPMSAQGPDESRRPNADPTKEIPEVKASENGAPAASVEAAAPKDEAGPPRITRDRIAPSEGRTPPASIDISLRGGPLLLVGEGPAASLGGRFGLHLRRGMAALTGELRGGFSSDVASADGGTAHARVLGGALAPRFCRRVRRAHLLDRRGCGKAVLGRKFTATFAFDLRLSGGGVLR